MGGLGGIRGSGGSTPRRSERASGGDLEPERFRCGLGARNPVCLSLVSPLAPARALSFSGPACPLGSWARGPAPPLPGLPDPLLLPWALSLSEARSPSLLSSTMAAPLWKHKSARGSWVRLPGSSRSGPAGRHTYGAGPLGSWSLLFSCSGRCPQAWRAPSGGGASGSTLLMVLWSFLSRSTGGGGAVGQM